MDVPPRAKSGNRFAYITFAIVAVYLVIALETSFVVFGVLPVAMALRSSRSRERLAPVAIAASALAILVAVLRLTHH